MIQALYIEFLKRHCRSLSAPQVQRLTTSLAGYICRVTKSSRLMKCAKELGIEDDFRDFRRRLDGNPYASSRMWRAVWAVMGGGSYSKALRRYEILAQDIEWVMAHLSSKRLAMVEQAAAQDWLRRPDYEGIEREVLSMKPFCQRFAAKKMTFLVKYDPSLTLCDLESEMVAAGLSAAYRSDHRTDNLVWLRNIAWRSAKNHAVSIIKHHTTKARQRIERKQQTVQMETTIKHYTRTHCWKCKEPSEEALCSMCSAGIMASKIKREKWDGRRENAHKFMEHGAHTIEIKAGPHKLDQFVTTTAFLDAPVKNGGNNGEGGEVTLLDLISDRTIDHLYTSPETTDLVHDLCGQPQKVQQVCAVILGKKDPEFDAWLVERHGDRAEGLRDKKLTAEACEFYGLSRHKLRVAMAPLLGVEHHA